MARLVVVADFRLILTRRFLELPERRCYNLHGSLLPAYRGAAPVARAVLAGDTVFGVTLYQMVKALDAGPVVATRELRTARKQDCGAIEAQLSELAADFLEEWLPVLKEGEVPLEPQDDSLATLAPKLSKEEGWIDWQRPPESIENHVLGMRPWPRAFTHWCSTSGEPGVLLFIDDVLPLVGEYEALDCGTVRSIDGEGVHVACGPDGTRSVVLRVLQRAGKKSLPAAEFVRGQRLGVGHHLATPEPERVP